VVKLEHGRDTPLTMLAPGQGQMKSLRLHVTQFEEGEGRFVGKDSLDVSSAIHRPYPPQGVLGILLQRDSGQAVDSTPFADPVAGPDMIGVVAGTESRLAGLGGREIPPLSGGDLVQPVFRVSGFHVVYLSYILIIFNYRVHPSRYRLSKRKKSIGYGVTGMDSIFAGILASGLAAEIQQRGRLKKRRGSI